MWQLQLIGNPGTACLGIILDYAAALAAERLGKNPKQSLQAIALEIGHDELGVSALTVLKLAHGIARADTAERRETFRRFLNELISVVSGISINGFIAARAGDIDGRSQAKGIRIPRSDLLIAVTATDLGTASQLMTCGTSNAFRASASSNSE